MGVPPGEAWILDWVDQTAWQVQERLVAATIALQDEERWEAPPKRKPILESRAALERAVKRVGPLAGHSPFKEGRRWHCNRCRRKGVLKKALKWFRRPGRPPDLGGHGECHGTHHVQRYRGLVWLRPRRLALWPDEADRAGREFVERAPGRRAGAVG